MRTEKQHIYLINYSTECEYGNIPDMYNYPSIPIFGEITKDWNNDIKQSIIYKVSEILKDAYGFDKETYAEFQWVEGQWLGTLDVKYAKIYGQINYEKTIRYLNNRDGYELARIVVYDIEL